MRMSSSKQELRQALAEIASIAQRASGHLGHDDGPHGHGYEHEDQGAAGPDIGCVPRQLPERLLVKAAQTATRINPANGLNMAAMAGLGLSGDIMDPLRLTVLTSKYWGPRPRQLTVSFMETTQADLRARIVSHLNAWNRTGGISFVETRGTGQVRISRGGGGYWSYLGTDILHIPPNQQTMNLEGFTMNTSDGEYRRVIRHEAGHTLGFSHEHMRKELIARIDRQKAYDYFWRTQRWNRAMVDQQVLTPLDDHSIMGTPADEDSIMCYQLPGSITRDGKPIRGGLDINATDATFCAHLYPKSGAAAGASPNGPDREGDAIPAAAMPTDAASNIGDWDPRDDVEPDVASFH